LDELDVLETTREVVREAVASASSTTRGRGIRAAHEVAALSLDYIGEETLVVNVRTKGADFVVVPIRERSTHYPDRDPG